MIHNITKIAIGFVLCFPIFVSAQIEYIWARSNIGNVSETPLNQTSAAPSLFRTEIDNHHYGVRFTESSFVGFSDISDANFVDFYLYNATNTVSVSTHVLACTRLKTRNFFWETGCDSDYIVATSTMKTLHNSGWNRYYFEDNFSINFDDSGYIYFFIVSDILSSPLPFDIYTGDLIVSGFEHIYTWNALGMPGQALQQGYNAEKIRIGRDPNYLGTFTYYYGSIFTPWHDSCGFDISASFVFSQNDIDSYDKFYIRYGFEITPSYDFGDGGAFQTERQAYLLNEYITRYGDSGVLNTSFDCSELLVFNENMSGIVNFVAAALYGLNGTTSTIIMSLSVPGGFVIGPKGTPEDLINTLREIPGSYLIEPNFGLATISP